MIPFDDEIEKEKYNRVDTPQSSPKIQPNKGKKSNNNALMVFLFFLFPSFP